MWPFDEKLVPAQQAAYAYSGVKARRFDALIKLYSERYYPLPTRGGQVLVPERAHQHIRLALEQFDDGTGSEADALLEALRRTEQEVYGPNEVAEIREALEAGAGGEPKPVTASHSANQPLEEGGNGSSPQPQKDAAAKQESRKGNSPPKRTPPRIPEAPAVSETLPHVSGKKDADQAEGRSNPAHQDSSGDNGGSTLSGESPMKLPQGAQEQVGKTADAESSAAEKSNGKAASAAMRRTRPAPVPHQGLEAVHQALRALQAKVARLETQPPSTSGAHPALEPRIARLEQQLGQVAGAVQRVEGLQKEIREFARRLTGLEGAVKQLQKAIGDEKGQERALRHEQQRLAANVEAIESDHLELRQSLDEIQAWLDTHKSLLATLTDQLAALEEAIGVEEPTPTPPRKLLDLLMRKKP